MKKCVRLFFCLLLPLLAVEIGPRLNAKEVPNASGPTPEAPRPAIAVKAPLSAGGKELTEPQRIALVVASLQADQYCDDSGQHYRFSQIAPDGTPGRARLLLSALAKALQEDPLPPCSSALFAESEEELLAGTRNRPETPCRFLRALALAGLWNYHGSAAAAPVDKSEGFLLLEALAAEDPGNGIYPFFALGAVSGDGDSATTESLLRQFLRSTRFENPLLPLLLHIRRLGHGNASGMLLAVELFSSTGFPDFGPAAWRVKGMPSSDRNPADLLAFADWVDDRIATAGLLDLRDPWANLLEDAILVGIARAGLKAIAAPEPPNLRKEQWVRLFRRRAELGDFSVVIGMNSSCESVHAQTRLAHRELVESELRADARAKGVGR